MAYIKKYKDFINEGESIDLDSLKNGIRKDSINVFVQTDFKGNPEMSINIPLYQNGSAGKAFNKIQPPKQIIDVIKNGSKVEALSNEIKSKIFDKLSDILGEVDSKIVKEINNILSEYN